MVARMTVLGGCSRAKVGCSVPGNLGRWRRKALSSASSSSRGQPQQEQCGTEIPSTALRYSAATGGNLLGELTLEELSAGRDPKLAEPFAPGALASASGSSERRDFPSK
jgi:hypothetical protein